MNRCHAPTDRPAKRYGRSGLAPSRFPSTLSRGLAGPWAAPHPYAGVRERCLGSGWSAWDSPAVKVRWPLVGSSPCEQAALEKMWGQGYRHWRDPSQGQRGRRREQWADPQERIIERPQGHWNADRARLLRLSVRRGPPRMQRNVVVGLYYVCRPGSPDRRTISYSLGVFARGPDPVQSEEGSSCSDRSFCTL